MGTHFSRSILIVLLVGLFNNSLKSQNCFESSTLTKGWPEEVCISSSRLLCINKMLEQAIVNNEIPGAVALIARNGKIIYHEAFGYLDAEKQKKLEINSIFRIASQTKAITSTAVMMLWEEGGFKLDDPISNWIPEFKNPRILDSLHPDGSYTSNPAKNEITIRHLLTHTSGLGYGEIDGDERFKKLYRNVGIVDLFTTEDVTISNNIKKLASLPLHHEPGAKYYYGENLDVLGYFIEIISGMPFDEFLRQRLFDPLGMNDTYFYLPNHKKHRLVDVLTKKDDKWVEYPITYYDPDYPIKGSMSYFSGGAGLVSTAADYAKFLQMYLNVGVYGNTRLLSRKTIELIMTNQVEDLWANDGKYYGLAFSILDEEGVEMGGMGSIGTFDWGGYFNTLYCADPVENLIAIIMKQTYDIGNDDTTQKFRALAFQSIND